MIKVSIILVTYNGERFIEGAIRSVLSQTYDNWELIVVDDGSTDSTSSIVGRFKNIDRRIRYVFQKNAGQEAGRNNGIAQAQGSCIALIDDDDEWIDSGKLAKQVEFLDEHPDYVLVGTGMKAVREDDEPFYDLLPYQTDELIRRHILFGSCFANSSTMIRKDAFLKVGGYAPRAIVKNAEDYELWLRLGMVGKMANLPFYGILCRIRTMSVSGKNIRNQQLQNVRLIRRFWNHYPRAFQALCFAYMRLLFRVFFKSTSVRPVINKFLRK